MSNYLSLTIKEINTLLKSKQIKPLDLVNEAFYKIEHSSCNAFITLNKAEVIKEALALESMEVDNLLFGIPIAIKDNIITKDLRTTCASLMLDNFIPIYDATVIERIKEHKMLIIGKTNMDEFAMGSTGETSYYGPILNPWDNSLVPGGSSSGSIVAVSQRAVVLSLGSDTGGSIRQPASFCGVVGLKPTYGRVSRYGLVAFASSLDQIGPIAKNVYENALLLNIIAGFDIKDMTSSKEEVTDFTALIGQPVKGMKIAVPRYYMSDTINEEVRHKVEDMITSLKEAGCIVDMVDIPYLEYAIPLYQVIALGEASSNLARFDGIKYGYATKEYNNIEELYKKTRAEGFGSEVKRRIMIGSYVLSGANANLYYRHALVLRKAMVDSFNTILSDYDLIIGPTNTNVAYKLGSKSDDALKTFYDDLLTNPVNMTGLPALSLPVGFNAEHLPIGLQIIGNYFHEDQIYQLAAYLEDRIQLDFDPQGGIKC